MKRSIFVIVIFIVSCAPKRMPPGLLIFKPVTPKIVTSEIYEIRDFTSIINLDSVGKDEASKMIKTLIKALAKETDDKKIYDLKFQIAYLQYRYEMDIDQSNAFFSELKDKDTVLREYATFFYAKTLQLKDQKSDVIKNMFENIATFFPQSPLQNEVNLELAGIYNREKNYSKVRMHLDKMNSENLTYADKREFEYLLISTYLRENTVGKKINFLCPKLDIDKLSKEFPQLKKACDYHNKELKKEEIFELATLYKKSLKYSDAIYLYEEYLNGMTDTMKRNNALKEIADCYKRMGNNEKQISTYSQLKSEVPDAQGLERFAVVELKLGQYNDALELLSKAYNDFHDLSDELVFMLGRAHLEQYNLEQAQFFFRLVTEKFHHSSLLRAAQFRLGIIAFIQMKYKEAESYFEEISKSNDEEYLIPALYWKARAHNRLNSVEAQKLFQEIIAHYPLNYYGLLSRNFVPTEWKKRDNNFNGVYAVRLESLSQKTTKYLETAEHLLKLGLLSYAQQELSAIDINKINSLELLYYLAVLYHFADDHYNAALTLVKIPNEKLPDNHVYIKWPQAYFDTFTTYANKVKINPYLPLSIARQETILRKEAVSPADAFGLMQLIPPTAVKLAENLGKKQFKAPEDLLNPEINIELGSYFLSTLSDSFGNNPVHTIAAYNAGKEIVSVWLGTMKNFSDSEVFVEVIPFKETREYVKRIFQNITIYELLYENKNIKLDLDKKIR